MHDDSRRGALDVLIDDTARALTAGMPSARLRADVRARIAGSAPSRTAAAWRLACATAAVVVLTTAVLWWRADAPWHVPSEGQRTRADIVLPQPAAEDSSRSLDRVPALAGRSARAIARRPGPPLQDAPPGTPAAHAAIPPLNMGDVRLAPIELDSIESEPVAGPVELTIEEIDIDPITTE